MKASITLEVDEQDLAKLIADPPRSIVPGQGSWTVPVGRVLNYAGPFIIEDAE